MKKLKSAHYLILLLFLASSYNALAQVPDSLVKQLSLKEAQEYAVKNFFMMKNSRLDVDIAKKRIKETLAIGLPQVSGNAQYQYFVDIPTSLLPDFITPAIYSVNENNFGLTPTVPQGETQFFPVQFGTTHNLSFGATLSQLIFSGEYIIGVKGSKTYLTLNEEGLQKTDIEVRHNVAQSYMALAIQLENRRLLIEGKTLIDKTLFETSEMYKNGFVEDVVVDQIKLNQINLANTITAINRQVEYASKLLKFQTGIQINDTIILKDSIGSLLKMIQLEPVIKAELDLKNHIDYKLVTTSEEIQRLNLKLKNATYLPTIGGFLSYSEKSMSNDFNMFSGGAEWYPTTLVGLNIDIPIFSSGQRLYKVQQARMALEKATNIKEATGEQLTLEAEQARTNFNTALENYTRESENMTLANNIYQKTNRKFTEGMATSTDITTVYNQLLNTQTSYYMSVFNLLNAKIKLDKALNRY